VAAFRLVDGEIGGSPVDGRGTGGGRGRRERGRGQRTNPLPGEQLGEMAGFDMMHGG